MSCVICGCRSDVDVCAQCQERMGEWEAELLASAQPAEPCGDPYSGIGCPVPGCTHGYGADDTKITRVTLVDESGVVFERYGLSVQTMLQDDGRTLKVFVKSDNPAAAVEAKNNLTRDIAAISEAES